MKIKTDMDCDDIGCAFADAGSDQQAEFFNAIGRFWWLLYKGKTDGSQSHSQMCWIVDSLNHDALTFLNEIGEFAKLELEKKS